MNSVFSINSSLSFQENTRVSNSEKIALAKAGEAGIAPRVAFQSLSKGILITEFIDGRHWTPSTLDDSSNLDALVKLVKRVHELDSRLPVTNYYQHAENYWNQLIHRGCDIPASLRKMRTRIIDQCSAEGNVGMRSVLCHRDVSPTNVIERDGRLYLLDWEYATRGASEFDFASIQFEWNVPTERLIVAADLCRSRLRLAAELYEYTCHLWELLNDTLSN